MGVNDPQPSIAAGRFQEAAPPPGYRLSVASRPSFTNCSIYWHVRLSAATQSEVLSCDPHRMEKTRARWIFGDRVATPNGFIAEILSVRGERARIRYLSTQPGPDEIELPLRLLRPATARDLLLAGIK